MQLRNSTSFPKSVLLTIVAVIFLIIQIVMIIVTFVYIKKHTLEENVQIKKAVAKVLVYIFIASIVTFIGTIVPALSFLIIPGSTIVIMTARSYLARLLFSVPGIATPIVAIALLKPVRDAIKTMPKNLFCKKDNKIHPTTTEENTDTTELQTSSV